MQTKIVCLQEGSFILLIYKFFSLDFYDLTFPEITNHWLCRIILHVHWPTYYTQVTHLELGCHIGMLCSFWYTIPTCPH